MSTTPIDLESRPRLRDEIIAGPAQLHGGRIVHYLCDRRANRYHRVGQREQFLLGGMDGRTTLEELGRAYEAQFQQRLDAAAWRQLFDLLEARDMLKTSGEDSAVVPAPPAPAPATTATRGWLTRELTLAHPDALLAWLAARTGALFHPAVAWTALGSVCVMEVWLLANAPALISAGLEARRSAAGWEWPTLVALALSFSALHELGHGLTLHRFGGRVRAMGVIFRYLLFFPYTRIDDVVLLHDRRQQVAVAFAGTFVSWVLLLPFAIVWRMADAGTGVYRLSALMLTTYHVSVLLNLCPFVQLDGYYMLAFYLRRPTLRTDAGLFLWDLIRRTYAAWRRLPAPEPIAATRAYSRSDRRILLSYGSASFLVTLGFVAMTLRFWHRWLSAYFGSGRAWIVAVAFIVAIACVRPALSWIRTRGRAWIGSDVPESTAA